jgi:hypothetical protein
MQKAADFVINNSLVAFVIVMRFWLAFILLFAGAVGVDAQAKRNTRPSPIAEATPEATPTPDKPKRNERPTTNRPNAVDPQPVAVSGPQYRYEFTQPDFLISRVVIEHNDAGKGTIAFRRMSYDEDLTEPITVSAVTMEKLKAAFEALNFLDSTEDYQFERDFSNMGNSTITLRDGSRERTAKYNWTSNKDAKFLMDEYRRLSNQFVWMFDFNLARENQPLETPKLVESLDGLLKRNEISDPHQMLPFLTAVSNDERVPLIGRNRAGKIVKQIEKQKN